jgi:hypothetical protein
MGKVMRLSIAGLVAANVLAMAHTRSRRAATGSIGVDGAALDTSGSRGWSLVTGEVCSGSLSI